MSIVYGGRHKHVRIIAGKTEHHTLVSCALLLEEARTFLDTLIDVRGLLVKGHEHAAGIPAEAHDGLRIADLFNGLACYTLNIQMVGRGYLAGYDYQSC